MAETVKEKYLRLKREIIMKYLSHKLNPMQSEAAVSVNGPVLIIAGAGSGKTTVLVERIAFIIKYGNAYHSEDIPIGIDEAFLADMQTALDTMTPRELEMLMPQFASNPCPSYAMLAITFTNKAAKEIKERLAGAFSNDSAADEIWAGTFHSICVRILRRFTEQAGYAPDFTIYDTDDKKHLLSEVMRALEIDEKLLPVKTVANEISHAKDTLKTPEEYETGTSFKHKQIQKIYEEYQKRLKKCNALDFDDIIAETVYMLRRNPDVLEYYQNKFRYVCVDEYQDTNLAQFRLTELLSAKRRNIMVVGDDDQSIYRFRGATIENILNFDVTYSDARIIKLEQNYRSTRTILDAANAVIAHNDNRRDKALWCDGEQGEKITLYTARDQIDEARYIAETVTKLTENGSYTFKDFAILYRVNEIARSLESVFAKSGIPYRILGGQRFYDKKEIKDIIAYLHIIENDRDDQRLKRIINEPKRQIGAKTVETVSALSADMGESMLAVMRAAPTIPLLAKTAGKLTAFTDMIEELRRTECSVSELVALVFEKSGYHKMLIDAGLVEQPRIAAVEELISGAKEYEARTEEPTLSGFLEEVSLVADVDRYDESSNAVVMMTVHSAKGLEFPVVFLSAMEENIFPSSQNIYNHEELSEERRLAYVAITRAKRRLFVTSAEARLLYGRTEMNALSRFIAKEVPPNLTEKKKRSFEQTLGCQGFRARPNYNTTGAAYSSSGASRTQSGGYSRPDSKETLSREFMRSVTQDKPRTTAASHVESLPVGCRVSHAIFGSGTIVSARDMKGDILYEVSFDNGTSKKLMATFAKLKRL